MMEWLQLNLVPLINVIIIDVVLAGDNAIIVGLAASRVREDQRARVIFWASRGPSACASSLLAWRPRSWPSSGSRSRAVCCCCGCAGDWEIVHRGDKHIGAHGTTRTGEKVERPMSFRAAVTQIIVADLSMSLDNVLAVAGAAKGSAAVLAIGLGVAIVLMAVAANFIANILARYPWIAWIGLLVILWVAIDMVFDGSREVACVAWKGVWCAPDLPSLIRGLMR